MSLKCQGPPRSGKSVHWTKVRETFLGQDPDSRAGEMAQQYKALAALPQDQGLCPNIYMVIHNHL